MIQHHSQKNMFSAFCQAFGGESVREEIETYWNAGGSPFPQDVYEHLVEKRKKFGKISSERAKFLIDYFNESFAPEQTTGYADRHREPLVAAFAEEYANTGARPIFRIEADIMNLGGLNRDALETSIIKNGKTLKGTRHIADSVIRVMSGILHEELAKLGKTSPIRHGGDELCIYLRPEDTATDLARINQAIDNAQRAIAVFISEANLSDVVHTKQEKMPGVGIGCAAIQLTGQSKLQQHQQLEEGVAKAKESLLNELGTAEQTQAFAGDRIAELLKSPNYSKYRELGLRVHGSVLKDGDYSGSSPEEARLRRLTQHLKRDGGALTAAEDMLLQGTHHLTAKRDPATDLLLFRNMRRDILPNFKAELPEGETFAHLVHIDFDKLGGGNQLGYWVGNAMRKTFMECIVEALAACDLTQYKDYLTSQDGGKFALLLPNDLPLETIAKFNTAIEKQLHKRSSDEIVLSGEEMAASLAAMRKNPNYNDRTPHEPRDYFTIGEICSAKDPALKGAHVMVDSKLLDLNEPHLGDDMRRLEKAVQNKHGLKDKIIQNRASLGNYVANIAVEGNRYGNRRNWRTKVLRPDDTKPQETTR